MRRIELEFENKGGKMSAHTLADIFDYAPMWGSSSMNGLEAPIGWDDRGMPILLRLCEGCPHVLVGGAVGSGKSNLICTIICSLCHKYSPEELQICILDMKNGAEAFRYVDKNTGEAWLPHVKSARAVESAESFLDEIISEINKRDSAFKSEDVVSISEFCNKTGIKMPRILVVIEEFVMMTQNGHSSSSRLEFLRKWQTLLNLGRQCGVHVILATQYVTPMMMHDSELMLGNIPIRIALPGASGVLAIDNDSDRELCKPNCIINEFYGAGGKNNVFVHPLSDVNLFRASIKKHQLQR